MGVMSCSRNACDSIMCDTYVYGIGYVCNYCQEEFKEYLKTTGMKTTTKQEINKALQVFMETENGTYDISEEMKVDEFFNQYTKG